MGEGLFHKIAKPLPVGKMSVRIECGVRADVRVAVNSGRIHHFTVQNTDFFYWNSRFSVKTVENTSSVEKAFAVLEFLAGSGKPSTLQEVTAAVQLPKPTAYRLLRSLQDLGYVTRPSESRDYQVGPRTALLAAVDPMSELKAAARPLMRRLHEQFNETVNLGTLSGGQILYLDYIETTQALRFIVTPGQSDPWFSTALGRAIASQVENETLERLLTTTRFVPLTARTVKSAAELRRRVLHVRVCGFAEEIEESVQGVSCLAVSLASMGFPDAAMSLAVPIQRLTPRRRAKILSAFTSLIPT